MRRVGTTTSDVDHPAMLPELLEQTQPSEEIATVTAVESYDTRRCHNTIATWGAAPSSRRERVRSFESQRGRAPSHEMQP